MLIIDKVDFQKCDPKEYLPLIVQEGEFDIDEQILKQADVIGIEARLNGQLAGFALAKIYSNNPELISIFVDEKHRRQGIGSALFKKMQGALTTLGLGIFYFNYNHATPSGEALTKIIAKLGWGEPELYIIRYHFDAYAFDPEWIHHLDPLPPEIHIFPWKKRSVRDVFWIDYLRGQGRINPTIDPEVSPLKIDYPTSIGMRHNDTLIGWSVTHRIHPNTIRYSSLFIDHFFPNSGYGIRLLVESIRRHKELPVPRAIFEINLKGIDRTWGLFVKKRLLPLADKVEKIHRAMHSL